MNKNNELSDSRLHQENNKNMHMESAPAGEDSTQDSSYPFQESDNDVQDFNKWRTTFFKIDCIFTSIAFLLEILLFFYMYSTKQITLHPGIHFLFYVLLPTLLCTAVIPAAVFVTKKMPPYALWTNAVPIFVLVFINAVISMVYCNYFSILNLFCIPIFMTAIFNNHKLCRLTTDICMICTVITSIRHYLTLSDPSDIIDFFPQLTLSLIILIIASWFSQTMLSITKAQKEKLMKFAKTVKEAHNREKAANNAKSAFLANMSHEIRTPINAILGMNEMILRENENEQIKEYAENIHAASTSLLSLINDVLDISKIESGKLDIIDFKYETSSFIHDSYNMVAERAKEKGLKLHIDCDPNLPSQLKGDEARLRQIVTNLLSNAVKYTNTGSIVLSVGGTRKGDQFLLSIAVKDTGIGIKEENLKNLFSQFERFDLEKNRNIEGTGLGLAITKQLLDLMQGEIRVESVYGSGSTFTAIIPQQIIDSTPMGDFHKHYQDISHANARHTQSFEAPEAHILVIDDVVVNLKVIVNLLKGTKIKVDTAESGKICLDLVTKNSYDLIFMDHMMPEMDGIETYKRMKHLENSLNMETPVIMLTANAINGVKEQYLNEGFADYLSKPVRGDKLERILLKYLPHDKIRKPSPENADNPPAKIQQAEQAQPASDTKSPNSSNINILQNLFHAYPHVDIPLALSLCGQDSDLYISILRVYVESDKKESLNEFYAQKDTHNYQVLVHGIKSSSLNIGFSDLSEKAHALEDAARDADWDFIEQHHDSFMADYETALESIKKAVM